MSDSVDISQGTSTDCNSNGTPDECDIASGAPDCDGGPTGNPTAGGNIINTFCFGCHGPDGFGVNCGGGSCPGPVLRNKTRTTISNKLLPPTDHPGGAFPGFTPQDFADIETFLNDTGHPPARPDGIIDTCQTLPDCDNDGTKDGCEFGAGTASDDNFDGIPDNCQAVLTGACCNSGGCTVVTASACGTAGGSYQGDNTLCSPNPCPPANNNCANALPIADGATPFSTVNATTDGPDEPGACTKFSDTQVNQDIWFVYTASCTGELTLSTCNAANYDTKIAVYEGTQCPATSGTALACRDDVAGCSGNTTTLDVPVVQGNSYLIRVGGYASASGTGTLTLTCNAFECVNNGQCDDSDPCTADTCENNVCVFTPIDTDNDGTPDCSDGCPNDPNKTAPGQCGCGVADTDTDNDGTADCNDGCPNDPNKIAPGQCGCGVADTDTDSDGTADCNDGCPNDPNKIAPGICGCGVADTDSDNDGTADCDDGCPADPLKIAPGNCGCGVVDTAATGDMDGIGGPDGADIQLFTEAVIGLSTDPVDLCPGDFSANGVMDFADVPGMVTALLSVP
ncbi:MAG: hypothetical protein IPK83_07870 [Planctomycetes bacterium]|nr:hypothetical protein [Planctomycetota bacterium]